MEKLINFSRVVIATAMVTLFPYLFGTSLKNIENFSQAGYVDLNSKLEAMYADYNQDGIIDNKEKDNFWKNFNFYLSENGIVMEEDRLSARFVENGEPVAKDYIKDLASGSKTRWTDKLNWEYGSDGTRKYEPDKTY